MKRLLYFIFFFLMVLVVGSVVPGASAITRGYSTDDKALRPGLLVALSPDSTPEKPKVERATYDKIDKIVGIATTADESLLTIASANQSIFVENDGETDAYVTNLNHSIQKGNNLTISPLSGILMKEDDVHPIVAIALEDFDEKKAEKYAIEDGSTKSETLVTKIRVSLHPRTLSSGTSSARNSPLQRIGRSLTGKDVSEVRILIAFVIFITVLVAEGGIIYGAISSSITSVGRNPLARSMIRGELIRILAMAAALLLFGLGSMYGILRV